MVDPPRVGLKLDLRKVKEPKVEQNLLKSQPGRLQFPTEPSTTYEFTSADLIEAKCIGAGNYGGVVYKMFHRPTGNVMAVKRVRAHEIEIKKREMMLRELKIIMDSQNCEDVVRFFGALFQDVQGDCWICMELMDSSLDLLYKRVYEREQRLPEQVIGFTAAAVVRALKYLKDELKIIHRDVKPSNILLDRRGFVKLCDFGISGYLVDSIAKTQDIGCQVYMAPERFTPKVYDIRSDVWSLGISLVEICLGRFPYKGCNSVFEQVQTVVNEDPPFLKAEHYSLELVAFVNGCLVKETRLRPDFNQLTKHPFFQKHNNIQDAVALATERAFLGDFVASFIPPPDELC